MKEDESEPTSPAKTERTMPVATASTAAAGGDDGFTSVGKGGRVAEADDRPVLVRLREVLESRGKKVIYWEIRFGNGTWIIFCVVLIELIMIY
jgi:translation initiation factor 3 subunit C